MSKLRSGEDCSGEDRLGENGAGKTGEDAKVAAEPRYHVGFTGSSEEVAAPAPMAQVEELGSRRPPFPQLPHKRCLPAIILPCVRSASMCLTSRPY